MTVGKNWILAVALAVVTLLGSEALAQNTYNNSFNNNSGTINIYNSGNQGNGGGYTYPVYTPVYTQPTYYYVVPTTPVYYYTYPTTYYYYTVPTVQYNIRVRY